MLSQLIIKQVWGEHSFNKYQIAAYLTHVRKPAPAESRLRSHLARAVLCSVLEPAQRVHPGPHAEIPGFPSFNTLRDPLHPVSPHSAATTTTLAPPPPLSTMLRRASAPTQTRRSTAFQPTRATVEGSLRVQESNPGVPTLGAPSQRLLPELRSNSVRVPPPELAAGSSASRPRPIPRPVSLARTSSSF